MTDEEHRLLNEFVSDLYGISFNSERRHLLESRLKPRLQTLQLQRYMDYYLELQYGFDTEMAEFTRLLTNNETYFFRETKQFDALLEEGWEDLIRGPNNGRPLRVLCAGCSSGEEPYTLKIFATGSHSRVDPDELEIDGFDIDSGRLATAKCAEYGQSSMRAANERQIRRFFARTGSDLYTLNSKFREAVNFSRANILDLSTYPSGGYDAVFCRNVLIYFSESALYRAVENFASALRPGGLLFLGHAESIIGLSDSFETVRFERCIAYRRKR